MINIYNGPWKSLKEGKIVATICSSDLLIEKRTRKMGYFNLYHID